MILIFGAKIQKACFQNKCSSLCSQLFECFIKHCVLFPSDFSKLKSSSSRIAYQKAGKSIWKKFVQSHQMKGSSKLYCFNRYTERHPTFVMLQQSRTQTIAIQTHSLFRSLKIISSLLKIERHHPQRDWGISSGSQDSQLFYYSPLSIHELCIFSLSPFSGKKN